MLTTHRPARVAVLCSRRAPGLADLLETDGLRGTLFDIACVITSERTFEAAGRVAAAGATIVPHPIAEFCAARSSSVYHDMVARRAYDRATAGLLEAFAPDLVLLDGYLFVLTRPVLDAFSSRIVNLHFSDLTIRRADGGPSYAGVRAVRDAVADGRSETRATVHLVNHEPDGGPPIVRSWPFPVAPLVGRARRWNAADMIKAYAYAHQEWMIRAASGPLLAAALQLVCGGHVDLRALSRRKPSTVVPWLLDESGRLTPPETRHAWEQRRRYREASA
jgi:folate-dependent phosphoribosylglycinamide formyltransferase PurN